MDTKDGNRCPQMPGLDQLRKEQITVQPDWETAVPVPLIVGCDCGGSHHIGISRHEFETLAQRFGWECHWGEVKQHPTCPTCGQAIKGTG